MRNDVIKPMHASRGRPKTIDYEATLDLAMKAYWSKGIDGMSVNEVCRLAKVSKPSLYREFGNEDGLLQAVFQNYGNGFRKTVRYVLEKHDDFECSIDELVDFMSYTRDEDISPKGCLGVKAYPSLERLGEKSRAALIVNNDKLLKIFEEWITRSSKTINLASLSSINFAAEFVYSMFIHGMKMNALGDSPEKIKRVMKLALSPLITQ